jgi:hypothetical protein
MESERLIEMVKSNRNAESESRAWKEVAAELGVDAK